MRSLFVFFSFLAVSGFAQTHRVVHYSIKNGLPQNSVNALLWDKQHFLWILTEDGAVRFDGNSLTVLRDDSSTGMHKDRLRMIVPSKHHTSLLFAAGGGICRTTGSSLNTVKCNQLYLRNATVDRLTVQEAEWIFGKEIMQEMDKHNWQSEHAKMVHTGDVQWVLGRTHLLKYTEQQFKDSIILPPGIHSMIRVGEKVLLIGRPGLYFLNPHAGKIDAVPVEDASLLLNKNVRWFQQPFTSYALITLNRQVFKVVWSNKGLSTHYLYTLQDNEAADNISSLAYHDKIDQLAIGTFTNGMYMVKPYYFHTMKDAGTYAHEKFNDTTVLSASGYMHTEHTKTTASMYDLSRILTKGLVLDKHGYLWSHKSDSLLVQKKNQVRKAFYTGNRFRVHCIAPCGDSIYVLTQNALLKFHGLHADTVLFNTGYFQLGGTVCMVACGSNILVGTEHGVFSLNSMTGEVKQSHAIKNVWMLVRWKDHIIGSSFNQGLFVLYKNQLVLLPADPHQYLRKAHQLYESPNGNLYVSTNMGLLQTHASRVTDYLEGKSNRIPWQYYTDEDGIENIEFNGGCSPGTIALGNGIVTFSNMGGLVWFRPAQVEKNRSSAELYISQVSVDNVNIPVKDSIIITASSEQISIKPACIYWNNPLDIKMEYKLEGYMSEFRPLGKPGEHIVFTQLPAGTYRLVMRCSTGTQEQHEDELEIIIIKRPRFYETSWFYLFVFLLALGVVVCANIIYNKRLRKQNRLLEEKVSERTVKLQQSNTDLMVTQKELLQSINVKNKLISIIAHDIITPLRFISRVSKNFGAAYANDEKTGEMMGEIHHTSQRLYDNAQNVLNWIRYQNNTIAVKKVPIVPFVIGDEIAELFADVAALRNNTVTNHIEMEDVIETDKTILGIVLQNLVSNAVKHTRNAAIGLYSRHTNRQYIITIKDNGQGMSLQSLLRIEDLRTRMQSQVFSDSSEGTGLGYIIILELSALIGAQVKIESNPQGTAVHIIFLTEPS